MTVAYGSALTSTNINSNLISRTDDQSASGIIDFVNGLKSGGVTVGAGGKLLQEVLLSTSTVQTFTPPTSLPADDTVPQITEGSQFLTGAVTNVSATSTWHFNANIMVSGPTNGNTIVVALFKTGTSDALAVGYTTVMANDASMPISFSYSMAAGAIASQTFSLRVGSPSGTNVGINGRSSGARFFGAVVISSLSIREVEV